MQVWLDIAFYIQNAILPYEIGLNIFLHLKTFFDIRNCAKYRLYTFFDIPIVTKYRFKHSNLLT